MRSIEIVTHCWRYSRLLHYQLESLAEGYGNDRRADVRPIVTIFSSARDDRTTRVVYQYGCLLNARLFSLPLEKLYKRAIGRNEAALATTADWIWFTDCDYLFGPKCLHELAALDPAMPLTGPVYPRVVHTAKDWKTGDAYLDSLAMGNAPKINPADFYPRGIGKAIGGIQIAPGHVARQIGYCRGSRKRQAPLLAVTPQTPFGDFASDRAFRCEMGGYGTPVDLSDVYRLRHSKSFRDEGGADN